MKCWLRFLGLALLALLTSDVALAFPPAPYYTLYGIVRDQVGQTVTAEGAEVILLKGGVEVGRTPINLSQTDSNYQLFMRIDQARSGTTFYTDKAVAAGGLFSLVVAMNGELFYPIEVSGTLTAGKGGERVKLDLTLGEDKDKDGLPGARPPSSASGGSVLLLERACGVCRGASGFDEVTTTHRPSLKRTAAIAVPASSSRCRRSSTAPSEA